MSTTTTKKPRTETINRTTLVARLMLVNSAAQIQARTTTTVKLSAENLRKLGISELLKRSTIHAGSIGESYGDKVNDELKRRHKKADFKPEVRAWGTKIGTCLVTNDAQTYLEVHNPEAALPVYGHINAEGNFSEIPRSQVEAYLPRKSSKSARQAAKGIGENFQNTVRVYKLASLNELVITDESGETVHYSLVP